MNAGKLATTYHPRGRVNNFWLTIKTGEVVTFDQLVVAVISNMVPDVIPEERDAARANLHRAVRAAAAADAIAQFCRFCMTAELRRELQKSKRVTQWRNVCLSALTKGHGRISSITAMGFGTWAADGEGGGRPMVAGEQMELQKEFAEVTRLIGECESDLAVGIGDAFQMEMTLKSLQERAKTVHTRLDEEHKRHEEKEREAEEMRTAMVQRVISICERAKERFDDAVELVRRLARLCVPSDAAPLSCFADAPRLSLRLPCSGREPALPDVRVVRHV